MSCFCERKELKQVKVFVKARNVKPCINQFERITLYFIVFKQQVGENHNYENNVTTSCC